MTRRENEILTLIKIKGRGYILTPDEPIVTVIGGANIDICGYPFKPLKMRDSNPGVVKMSLGGVGRNIAENLARLGVTTRLITAVGGDFYGKYILEKCREVGLNTDEILILAGENSSVYLSVMDGQGDMAVAVAGMEILEYLTLDYFKYKLPIIGSSKVCVVDTNLPLKTLEYLLEKVRGTAFFVDGVSAAKAVKLKELRGEYFAVKLNKIEAAEVTGEDLEGDAGLRKAANYFLRKGVKQVFFTLGAEGVFYSDGVKEEKVVLPRIEPVNATGAGDAFTAALVYSYLRGFDIDRTARFAAAMAVLTLIAEEAVNPEISEEKIINKMEVLGLC